MKKPFRFFALFFIPVLLASCSMNNADSISEQDAKIVGTFCLNYGNFYETKYPAVLDLESNYQSNVAILGEKYPENLELKQLNLSVQTAIGYVSWVREREGLVDGASMSIIEDVETLFGSTPPVSASAVTSSLTQSCEPFQN
jgi:hypothetical protein